MQSRIYDAAAAMLRTRLGGVGRVSVGQHPDGTPIWGPFELLLLRGDRWLEAPIRPLPEGLEDIRAAIARIESEDP